MIFLLNFKYTLPIYVEMSYYMLITRNGGIFMKKVKPLLAIMLILILIIPTGAAKKTSSKWILTEYNDASGNQGICYTLTNNHNKLIVIDGGFEANADKLRNIIKANGNHIDAWILTHPHPDHIGAFRKIYSNLQGIKISAIYDNGLDLEFYRQNPNTGDDVQLYDNYINEIKGDWRVHHLKRNELLKIDGLKIKVFNTYDQYSKYLSHDICNDSSLMLKVTTHKNSILFCGDCHSESTAKLLIKKYGKRLRANYVQMGHHGNNTLPNNFYSLVHPKVALFDAPQWLVDGKDYDTKKNMEFMKSIGAEVYYYATAPNQFKL